ncbi:MAG TPA: NAD-dependent epimerase/dehydratase family protein [Dermatophilaceae bacterium]
MSSPRVRVRSRSPRMTVAVTDGATPVGDRIVRALLTRSADGPSIGTVVGLGGERGSADGVHWRLVDLESPDLAVSLRGVDALIHVAVSTDLAADLRMTARSRREQAVRQIQTVVISAAAAGVGRLVVVTSAMTYGASPANAVPLPEDAPLAADPDEGLVGDLLAVEQILRAAAEVHTGLAITVVRPAALVGPGIDTVVTRHFEAPRLLTVRGGSPAWQFCHVEDLATALATTVERGLGPVVTVGAPGWLTQTEVQAISGMQEVELSESMALGIGQRLHRVGILPFPASDLSYAVYPWAVSCTTLDAAGWHPAYDNMTCLGALLEGIRGHHAMGARRLERKDAALGAASAAVALVGTAAIMRRRRRKGAGT